MEKYKITCAVDNKKILYVYTNKGVDFELPQWLKKHVGAGDDIIVHGGGDRRVPVACEFEKHLVLGYDIADTDYAHKLIKEVGGFLNRARFNAAVRRELRRRGEHTSKMSAIEKLVLLSSLEIKR